MLTGTLSMAATHGGLEQLTGSLQMDSAELKAIRGRGSSSIEAVERA